MSYGWNNAVRMGGARLHLRVAGRPHLGHDLRQPRPLLSRRSAVAAAGEFYWYCWGAFHAKGGTPNNATGFLGQQAGDLAVARCLVQANADSRTVPAARGTIFRWRMPPVGQPSAICDGAGRRFAAHCAECLRLYGKRVHLWNLWTATRGLVGSCPQVWCPPPADTGRSSHGSSSR
jgi:hypothetical protein